MKTEARIQGTAQDKLRLLFPVWGTDQYCEHAVRNSVFRRAGSNHEGRSIAGGIDVRAGLVQPLVCPAIRPVDPTPLDLSRAG